MAQKPRIDFFNGYIQTTQSKNEYGRLVFVQGGSTTIYDEDKEPFRKMLEYELSYTNPISSLENKILFMEMKTNILVPQEWSIFYKIKVINNTNVELEEITNE